MVLSFHATPTLLFFLFYARLRGYILAFLTYCLFLLTQREPGARKRRKSFKSDKAKASAVKFIVAFGPTKFYD